MSDPISILEEVSNKFEASLRERMKLNRKKGHLALNVVSRHQKLINEAFSRQLTAKEIHQSLQEAGVKISYTRFTVVWRTLNGRLEKGKQAAAGYEEPEKMDAGKNGGGQPVFQKKPVRGAWRDDPVRESLEAKKKS